MALKSIGVFGFALSAQLLACRDDSLVAWAAANTMFDVQLGKKERSNVVKLRAALGRNLHVYWFLHRLSNPFPELSAITPVPGPGADRPHSSDKNGLGVRNLSNPPNLFLDLPSVGPLPSSVAAVTAASSSNPGHTL